MDWVFSQHVQTNQFVINLGDDYTSGGALANSEILGEILTGTQQQWYTRGTKMNPYPHPAGKELRLMNTATLQSRTCCDSVISIFAVGFGWSGKDSEDLPNDVCCPSMS